MKRRKWMMGNWKMNGSLNQAKQFFEAFETLPEMESIDVGLAIPSVFLANAYQSCEKILKSPSIFLAAQDVSAHESGAYTGDISASMLQSIGVNSCIVGHSERRLYQGETNAQIAQKANRILEIGGIPVICIGERLEDRKSGQTLTVLTQQLVTLIRDIGIEHFSKIVLAYEPVWAIGTGLSATASQIHEVHAFVRNYLAKHDENVAKATRIIYGGSLKPSNAEEILSLEGVDGGLIGGASLKWEEFSFLLQTMISFA